MRSKQPLRISSLLFALCLALGTTNSAGAAELHVAPNGKDNASGTAAAPLATLKTAQQRVRELIRKGLKEPIHVVLHRGTYRLSEPLQFTTADSGTEQHAVLWMSAPGERAVLSGGIELQDVTRQANGIYRIALPKELAGKPPRELFANGRRRTRARHPNVGYLRVERPGEDKRTSLWAAAKSFPALQTHRTAELVFLHDWSTSRIPIDSADVASGQIRLTAEIGPNAPHYRIDHFEPHPRFFLENDPAFFDAAGEWVADAGGSAILYRPLPGEETQQPRFTVPVAEALLVAQGDTDQGRPIRNLHFVGLAFEHCAWSLPPRGYAAGQAGFHERRTAAGVGGNLREPIPTALRFEMADNCTFSEGIIRHLGGSGIAFGSRCTNCRLDRSVVTDVSGNGVLIGEDSMRRINNRVWWEAAPEQVAKGNAVDHCLIERCGVQFSGCIGIWAGITAETRIGGNLIRELPYTGVSLGWQWNPIPTAAKKNLVTGNHIHTVMQTLSDGGGIYTLGFQPGSRLTGNLIHDVPLNLGRAESNGMFLDEGTTDFLIDNNTIAGVVRSPLRFHKAGKNVVRGNTLVLSSGVPPVQFNNTPPENIEFVLNKAIPAAEYQLPPKGSFPAGPPHELHLRLEAMANE